MAHPRSRGENHNLGGVRPDMAGSSPLTRGRHSPLAGYSASRRLIPAHAGKTTNSHLPMSSPAAHPRSRGENPASPSPSTPVKGSSPLTRGKRNQELIKATGAGLIPAHAGKTGLARRRPARARAHPRSRGENHRGHFAPPPGAGSSPLTRGKRETGRSDVSLIRLIPAHAGKTLRSARLSSPGWAHPRSRGENSMVTVTRAGSRGSSPLTRGKRLCGSDDRLDLGLIPAHAGKTPTSEQARHSARAHPRSRGENRPKWRLRRRRGGSSPLTRGKHPGRPHCRSRNRLIPAHAGKTRIRSRGRR